MSMVSIKMMWTEQIIMMSIVYEQIEVSMEWDGIDGHSREREKERECIGEKEDSPYTVEGRICIEKNCEEREEEGKEGREEKEEEE